MITNSKDGKEQILSFGEEYWHRTIDENELQKDRTYEHRIDGATYWKDWEKIDASEYFAYLQLFTENH